MISFEEVGAILDEIAGNLPEEVFHRLNGGIVLLPDVKKHESADDLYILGQYHWHPNGLGRYIAIYYGSFVRAWGGASREMQTEKLREVLHHELTHHLEYLAGDSSLVRQDEEDLRRHLDRKRR